MDGKNRTLWIVRGWLRLFGGFLLLFGLLSAGACDKTTACQTDKECSFGNYCKEGSCALDCKDDSACGDKKVCQLNIGKCIDKTPPNTCTPKTRKGCSENKVFWFDSCDFQGEQVEDCGTQGCLDGVCKATNLCGDGTCDIGKEDCSSCPGDCPCSSDEACETGLCKKKDTCGDGTCQADKSETCASCPQDCACKTGEICEAAACKEQLSCGDGTCQADKSETCSSCPQDCKCPTGQACDAGTSACKTSCGDKKCDPSQGETCTSCPEDCACSADQRCLQGRCERTCGNGRCETAFNEDCTSCPIDCICPNGGECKAGQCGSDCGNGVCDADKGETCSSCSKDCSCGADKSCEAGQCKDWCGNRTCDLNRNETCDSCAQDCACGADSFCQAGVCKPLCGDGTCDAAKGEDCTSCPTDCACPTGQSCVNKQCTCVPRCQGRDCGSDGCNGLCGSCQGLTRCDDAIGKCACQNACQAGESKCTGSGSFDRCEQDAQGCYFFKNQSCSPGQLCIAATGSCCALACGTKECGDDGCGGNCGSCSQRANCNGGRCICTHECPDSGAECLPSGGYRECIKDASGCRYWSQEKTCGAGQACTGGRCCTPFCSGKECGTDGCTGSCGSCGSGLSCTNNQCQRKFLVPTAYVSCSPCNDDVGFITNKGDPYVQLTLSDGRTFKSGWQDGKCNTNVTFNWSVSNLDPNLLKSAKVETWDDDDLNSDDLCMAASGDFSTPGRRTLTGGNSQNIVIDVSK